MQCLVNILVVVMKRQLMSCAAAAAATAGDSCCGVSVAVPEKSMSDPASLPSSNSGSNSCSHTHTDHDKVVRHINRTTGAKSTIAAVLLAVHSHKAVRLMQLDHWLLKPFKTDNAPPPTPKTMHCNERLLPCPPSLHSGAVRSNRHEAMMEHISKPGHTLTPGWQFPA